jgi:phosphoribosylanthranilate isomerase
MRIKICGITLPEDARFAESEGADAIGVVMFSESPRSVSPVQAKAIFDSVGPFTATVAVTHTKSQADLDKILALHPTAIQIFHRFEFPGHMGTKIIRAIGREDPMTDDCDAIIVDESHGRGKTFDLSRVKEAVKESKVPVILAGGLTPENVEDAIRQVQPYAVDVATGVERSPGVKDHEKIRAFIAACRRV